LFLEVLIESDSFFFDFFTSDALHKKNFVPKVTDLQTQSERNHAATAADVFVRSETGDKA